MECWIKLFILYYLILIGLFYNRCGEVGYGRPLVDSISTTALIIIFTSLGIPVLCMFLGSIYLCVRKYKEQQTVSKYGQINWLIAVKLITLGLRDSMKNSEHWEDADPYTGIFVGGARRWAWQTKLNSWQKSGCGQ